MTEADKFRKALLRAHKHLAPLTFWTEIGQYGAIEDDNDGQMVIYTGQGLEDEDLQSQIDEGLSGSVSGRTVGQIWDEVAATLKADGILE